MTGSAVWLIARREIVTRLQQRGYRIGLLIMLAAIILACTLPAAFRGGSSASDYDVGIVGAQGALPTTLAAVGKASGATIHVHASTEPVARHNVRSGKWDAAIIDGRQILAQHSDDGIVDTVQQAFAAAQTDQRLHAAGLSTAQIRGALEVRPLAVAALAPAQNSQRQAIATITVIALFSQLVTFCNWIAIGVVEEKSSRVVELILSAVRPIQLLTGKLLGIGAVAIAQVALLGAAALISAHAAKTLTLPATGLVTVLVALIGCALGFAFFAATAAGLASTVARQEEVSGVIAPVTLLLTICYVISLTVTGDSTAARVLSIIPPISSLAMPGRIARGHVPVLDIIAAVLFLVVATAAILVVAGRIYRASVLHSGSRVRLRQAWRGEAVARVK